MAEATDVATNVMSAYGREADEMASVTDTLTATVSNHNQTMQGMASAMSTVAPIASSLGISLEETSAAIGQMGDVGIQGERAGTALRNVFSQLSDESSTVSTELNEMGVATRNSSGEIVSMTQLLSNMESAGVEAGDAAKIFGTEAGPAMAALMQEGSDALAQNTQRISDAEGATQSMAETQRDTLNAEMQIARSNIEDVGIAIGGDLIPMVSTLTGYISTGADRFQDLNGDQRRAIILLGGVAAAIGPVLFVGGTLLTMLPVMATGWGMATGAASGFAASLTGGVIPAALATQVALGPVTVPVWAIIAAIGAAIAISYGLYRAWTSNFYGVRDTATDALGTVKGWLDAAPGWMLLLLGPLGQLYLAWRENLFGIQDVTGDIFDWIGSKIDWLIDKIDAIPGINFGDDGVEVDEGAVGAEGAAAGEAYAASFEGTAQPDSAAMMPGAGVGVGAGEAIKGEMTPAIREALEDGVDGYVSDPDEIEDSPTEINEALFDAVSRQQGGATAESLGVSEAEFETLMQRFTGNGWSTSWAPSADLVAGASTSASPSAGSAGMSTQEFKTALREVLEGLRLETRLETDQRGLEQWIEDIADAQIAEAGRQR
jgi:TP901 family phage tail tape measure protein